MLCLIYSEMGDVDQLLSMIISYQCIGELILILALLTDVVSTGSFFSVI